MNSTDLLIFLQRFVIAGLVAILAKLLGRVMLRNDDASTRTLELRPRSQVLLLLTVIFVAEYLSNAWIPSRNTFFSPGHLFRILDALQVPIAIGCVVLVYREFRIDRLVNLLVVDVKSQQREESRLVRLLWVSAGFLVLFTILLLCEYRQPFYFTQDDNLAVNLAEILQGCRSLSQGVFPTWNPHQYLGSPNTTLGWYALTYPPTHISYWVARVICGNENATLEVFAFIHLLAGYLLLYWVIRREGCRPSLAMLGSLCCMASGYALIVSRSWYQFSAVLPWMALLVIGVQSLTHGNSGWKWILGFGAVMGVAFHSGHIQMWIYSVMMADLAILMLILLRTVPFGVIWDTVAAHFVALAIAAPLLVPQYLSTASVLRRYPDSRGIASGLPGLFLPASIYATPHPVPGWAKLGQPRYIGEMYFFGAVFMIAATLVLISFLSSRWDIQIARSNVWLFIGIIAFLLALGEQGVLWNWMMQLPVFGRFRFPFKFLAYIVVFVPIAGCVAIERLFRNKQWRLCTEIALAIAIGILVVYHSTLCAGSFFSYGFGPYPNPNPELARFLSPSDASSYPKVFPILGTAKDRFVEGGYRSGDPHFIDSYMNQWPSVLRAFSIEGYNPLVSESPTIREFAKRIEREPARALYEYGVEYVLQYDPPEESEPRRVQQFAGATLVYQTPTITLQKLPTPRPMSFPAGAPSLKLPVRFDGAGATIDTSGVPLGGLVVLNMLWRREFVATSDGKYLPVGPDDWGRISVQVSPQSKVVRIAFRPHWEYGFALSFVALLLALPFALVGKRRRGLGGWSGPEMTTGNG